GYVSVQTSKGSRISPGARFLHMRRGFVAEGTLGQSVPFSSPFTHFSQIFKPSSPILNFIFPKSS
ncbi:hypothetical protein A2U01_0080557, partial [Trifolium medium]|nr:hypothetical protein [Trifolium medium]